MPPFPFSRGISPARIKSKSDALSSGMSLLEMTVVILVLLTIIGTLFIGARAWMKGSARATCIMHISVVQRSMRGYANLYNFPPGTIAPDLLSQIIGPDRFILKTPICTAGGSYSFGQDYGVNTIPPMGAIYMKCSLAADQDHTPKLTQEW